MGVPTAVYYVKPMHMQSAFSKIQMKWYNCLKTQNICDTVLSLPMHPYLSKDDIVQITSRLREIIEKHELSNM